MRMLILLFLLIAFFVNAQDPYKNIYSRHAWKDRDAWQRADDLIRLLALPGDGHVADIGCHEGYMTFKLSRALGDRGIVYAVDIDNDKLEKVKRTAETNNIRNIQVIKGDYDNPKLPAGQLDAVIILDTYHEMDDHDEIIRHIRNALKRGGRLVICEPIAEARRKLDRADQERRHELGMSYALEDLKKAGFKIHFQQDPYIDRTREKGDKMWVVVAIRP